MIVTMTEPNSTPPPPALQPLIVLEEIGMTFQQHPVLRALT